MLVFVNLILLFIFLWISAEVFRRSPTITWIVFLILPILLIPYGLYQDQYDWFWWMKTYSVPAAVCLITLYRYTILGEKNWMSLLLWLVLVLNILEAVANEIETGQVLTYLNAAVGLLLILTIPKMHMKVDKSKTRDFLWLIPLGWIIGYTIWNWTFAYLGWHETCIRQIPVLLVPLLMEFWKPGIWFQIRAFTLGIYLIIRFIHEPIFKALDVPNFYHPLAAEILVGMGLLWMSLYALLHFYFIFKEKKLKSKLIFSRRRK